MEPKRLSERELKLFQLQTLKVTLEELGVVKDWNKINGSLIEDTIYGMTENGHGWIGSYYRYPDVERALYGPWLAYDIRDIRFYVKENTEFPVPKERILTSLLPKIEKYKTSPAFKKVCEKHKI